MGQWHPLPPNGHSLLVQKEINPPLTCLLSASGGEGPTNDTKKNRRKGSASRRPSVCWLQTINYTYTYIPPPDVCFAHLLGFPASTALLYEGCLVQPAEAATHGKPIKCAQHASDGMVVKWVYLNFYTSATDQCLYLDLYCFTCSKNTYCNKQCHCRLDPSANRDDF